jgi:hypothetical protein
VVEKLFHFLLQFFLLFIIITPENSSKKKNIMRKSYVVPSQVEKLKQKKLMLVRSSEISDGKRKIFFNL